MGDWEQEPRTEGWALAKGTMDSFPADLGGEHT